MPFLASAGNSLGYGHPNTNRVTTSSLQVYLDATNSASYPGSGSTWSNLGSAGTGYNFTLYNSPSYTGITYNSHTTSTLSFDGINDYTSPNTSLLSLATANGWAETREYWVYWRGSPGSLTAENGTSTPDTNWFDAQASMSNTSLVFSVWQNTSLPYVVNNTFTSNTWNHVVWQHSSNTNTLLAYVNGVRTYSNASVARVTPDTNGNQFYTILCAGSATNFGYGSASYLGANLAKYRWYNRILSSNEVAQNYNAERAVFGR